MGTHEWKLEIRFAPRYQWTRRNLTARST